MYDRILLALDNSGHARRATAVAIELARAFSSRVVGVHVTNPGLHGYAFRQMEEGLPEEYQDAEVLRRQREIHNTIIERGLGAISDSYLEIFREAAARTEVNAQTKILKGRHYEALAGEINA
ncbi:MAG: universal stress protein, partial [Armatimonadetes bacterium]|nr:universal stress protein [Armatimonadota bacterium]